MIVKKANDSLELLMKELEENNDVPDADLTDYPSKAQCSAAGNRGRVCAQELASTLGMDNRKPRPKFWAEPWMNESNMTREVRDADADGNVAERIVDPVFRKTAPGPEREVRETADERRDFVAEERDESADGAGGSEPGAGAAEEVPDEILCRQCQTRPTSRPRRAVARYATMEDDGDHEDAVRTRAESRGVIDEMYDILVQEGTDAASAATGDSAATAASKRVGCHVTSPSGDEFHKSTFNTELQIADAKGESVTTLSPDRLERV